MKLAFTIIICLLLCSCTTKPAVRSGMRALSVAPEEPVALMPTFNRRVFAVVPPKPFAIYWEHSGRFVTGFVVERTLDFDVFSVIGFVPATSAWATNGPDLTFRFALTNEPAVKASYRVAAIAAP